MTDHLPVRTLDDLLTLDLDEVTEGFGDGLKGEPEPGNNRSRAYWHGWRVGMMDSRRMEIDSDHRALVHEAAPGGRMDPRLWQHGKEAVAARTPKRGCGA